MFRGDMAAAAARYRAALGAQPNHVPTLTFLAYLLRDLAPDPVTYHRVQVAGPAHAGPTPLVMVSYVLKHFAVRADRHVTSQARHGHAPDGMRHKGASTLCHTGLCGAYPATKRRRCAEC